MKPKYLIFAYQFKQALKSVDSPNSVTHITFGLEFNQALKSGIFVNTNQDLTKATIKNGLKIEYSQTELSSLISDQ